MRYKVCTKCKQSKKETDYHVAKIGKYNRHSICKICKRKQQQNNYRSLDGMIKKMYATQLRSSVTRGHKMPAYGFVEFLKWVKNQDNFKYLYEEWVKSGYKKDLIPSVDRKNSNLPYCFENIQLDTWLKNKQNHNEEIKRADQIVNHKRYYRYSKHFIMIDSFNSKQLARRATGISIIESSKLGVLSGGYYWLNGETKEDRLKECEEIREKTKTARGIIQLDENMEFVKSFTSAVQASEQTKAPLSGICNSANERRVTAGKYIWMWDNCDNYDAFISRKKNAINMSFLNSRKEGSQGQNKKSVIERHPNGEIANCFDSVSSAAEYYEVSRSKIRNLITKYENHITKIWEFK